MPYYLITIKLHDGKKVQGIKVHNNANIDAMYTFFHSQASSYYRNNLKDFDCVIVAKQSKAYRKWIDGKKKKEWFDHSLEDIPGDPNTVIKRKERPIVSSVTMGERAEIERKKQL